MQSKYQLKWLLNYQVHSNSIRLIVNQINLLFIMAFNSDDSKGAIMILNYGGAGTSDNWRFRMNMNNMPLKLTNHDIAITDFQFYNVIPNFDSVFLKNTSFSYVDWHGTSWTVDLTQGLNANAGVLQIADINGILQATMFKNQTYFLDINGNPVFPLSLSANTNYDKVQIIANYIPSTFIGTFANYGYPNGSGTLKQTPGTGDVHLDGSGNAHSYMQIVIPTGNIVTNLGFVAGSYPDFQNNSSGTQSTSTHGMNTSFNTALAVSSSNAIMSTAYYNQSGTIDWVGLSSYVPQIQTVTGLTLRCNLAGPADFYPYIPNLLGQVPLGSTPSFQYFDYQPYTLQWRHVPQGDYPYIEIQICDQNGNPIQNLLENFGTSFTIKIMKRGLSIGAGP